MLALDHHQEEDDQPFDRRAMVRLLCQLQVIGVTVALVDGRIVAIPEKPPLAEEARELLKENKEALLTYLTTPPDDTRPCAACGRVGQWVLDWMAIWVCTCYFHPEWRTWPDSPPVVTIDNSPRNYWTKEAGQEFTTTRQAQAENGRRTGHTGQQKLVELASKKSVSESVVSARQTDYLSGESAEDTTIHAQNVSVTSPRQAQKSDVTLRRDTESSNVDAPFPITQAQKRDVTGQRDAENADSQEKETDPALPVVDQTTEGQPGHGFLLPGKIQIAGQLAAGETLASMPTTPETFLDLALDYHLTHLWVMPSVDVPALAGVKDEKGKEKLLTETHDILFNRKKSGVLTSLVGRRRKPHTENTRVIFLKETTWPQTITDLQIAIEEVETGLQVEMQASATSVGLRYLEKVDSRYYQRYFEKVEKIDWKAGRETFKASAHSLVWHRKPAADEAARRFLVAYDKRSAFPRAGKEEAFGIGEPVHQERPMFNHLAPGIWFARVSGLEKIDNRLPAPLWHTWHNPGWLSTQVVKLLLKMGASVEIEEAVIWPKKAPVFERWAGDLWEFRQKSRYPDAMKAILNNPLGFTINGDDMEDSTFRPDWYMTIVGSTRAGLVYNAMTIAKESGLYPVGAYIDALYYCHDERRIAGYLEKHPDSLGGYGYKWALALDTPIGIASQGVNGADCLTEGATVIDVLNSPMSWNYQLQIFNRLAGEE